MNQVNVMSLRLNKISGPLPQTWTTMATNALRKLWLHGNALTGVVPASWSHIGRLSVSGSFSIDENLKDIPVNYSRGIYETDDCPDDIEFELESSADW